ncbi:cold shock domain-containing protein [Pseudovibrio sp. Tun.PSC04-5.I4]|uniref:cold shock domain-containing protein n=1 Tax=Pseudovibrio sp. Tun.PSC04-5.I4 TaxID=1798213 RepID=UPI00087FAC76|nr:cold shock domain-containing protein [Pseudovibrio sp. Tun.PSC04-5.I4]SDR22327.1 'Cold-shock' DNA-binding domain-containing protein [Pseudovibrio sp. Tun.PSC04-5.I4]
MNLVQFGTVKSFDHLAGKGWITPDDGSHDIMVKRAAVKKARLGQICEGQTLGFRVSGTASSAIDLWATFSNR